MPRRPRIYIPGIPLHLIQRGLSRNPVFFSDEDRIYYRERLGFCAAKRGVDIHAYCLMTNHIHLLVSAPSAPALSRMMQDIGRSYVPYINRVYGRSGGLWEGRFKSCLVQTEEYFLTCMRYIEMNPVRIGMVASPEAYRWSSYGGNALGLPDPVLSFHEEYLLLGKTPQNRQRAYRRLFKTEEDPENLDLIRMATQQGAVAGEGAFVEFLQEQSENDLSIRKRGRPQSEKKKEHPENEKKSVRPQTEKKKEHPENEKKSVRPQTEKKKEHPENEKKSVRPQTEKKKEHPENEKERVKPQNRKKRRTPQEKGS